MSTSNISPITVDIEQLVKLRYAAAQVALANKRLLSTQRSGNYLSSVRGRGMDFDETRSYQAGDDIRFMDWRVMARTGKAHTKLFKEERERPVFLVVDQSSSMHFGTRVTFKSVIAAHAAAILAWAAAEQGDRIGGIVFNDHDYSAIKPHGRKQGVLHYFRQLVHMNQQPIVPATLKNPLENVLTQLRHVCHPGGLIFILSDFTHMSPAIEHHLRALSQHNEIVACQIYDELEKTPPPPDLYQVTDGKELLWLNTRKKSLQLSYMEQFSNQQMTLKETLNRQGIPLLELATHDDIAIVLYKGLCRINKS